MQNETFSVENLLSGSFSGLEVKDEANRELVNEILDKFGLRWTVEKRPLFSGVPGPDMKFAPTPFSGIVRTDTGTCFSTCKDGYVPYQNSELAELLVRISDKTGFTIHSGGMFNGGGKVYIQLNTGNEIQNLGKNRTTVKGYATGINSHDGTSSLKWGASNITICCRNTFAAASKELQERARHTASIHQRVEASIKAILGITEAEKTLFEQFIKLSNEPVKADHIAKIVRSITDVDINERNKDQYSTYAVNRSTELMKSIGQEMREKGETLWGLFSGVTHYTTHVLPVPKRDNARLESKYTGSALTIDNEAFAAVLDFAGIKN